jgi:endonuclease-8
VTTVDPKTGKKLAPSRLWVYDRAGRPCHRCGTLIEEKSQGSELPRTTYFCPHCQASVTAAAGAGAKRSRGRAAS